MKQKLLPAKKSPKRLAEVTMMTVQPGKRSTGILPNPGSVDKRNPAAVALGRLGGLKGGNARAKALTKAERVKIAKLGAQARWAKTATKRKRKA